jgi:hypothetical protein
MQVAKEVITQMHERTQSIPIGMVDSLKLAYESQQFFGQNSLNLSVRHPELLSYRGADCDTGHTTQWQ